MFIGLEAPKLLWIIAGVVVLAIILVVLVRYKFSGWR